MPVIAKYGRAHRRQAQSAPQPVEATQIIPTREKRVPEEFKAGFLAGAAAALLLCGIFVWLVIVPAMDSAVDAVRVAHGAINA